MPDAILSVLAAAAPSTTSILLASMGGLINRQGGIVNIGLEPMMLVGAFAAVFVSAQTGNPFLGLLAPTPSAALLARLFPCRSRGFAPTRSWAGLASTCSF